MIIPPPIDTVVRVTSPHSVISWRGRVVGIPAEVSWRPGHVDRVAVVPLERGKGWSATPVFVRLSVVEREE
jgi:hypothetical protein